MTAQRQERASPSARYAQKQTRCVSWGYSEASPLREVHTKRDTGSENTHESKPTERV